MQVTQETKWKRDQSGKWARVETSAKPIVAAPIPPSRPDPVPTVTFRTRTGKPITSIAAMAKLAVVASANMIGIHRGPDTRPLLVSASSTISGLTLTQTGILASLKDGHLCEHDITTGRIRLTSPDLGGTPAGPALAAQDGFVVTLESGSIIAVSGKLAPKWRFTPPSGTFGFQPAASVGRGIYVPGESTLFRLDALSGLVNWSTDIGDRGCITPTVVAGLAITASTGGGIRCLDATTGKLRWRIGPDVTGSATWTGIASAGLRMIAGTQQGDVVCIHRETGRLEWVRTGLGRVMFPPAGDVKHGCAVVFVQDTDAGIPAEVLGLDLRSGRTMWRARVGNLDAAPVLTGERLWIASTTGTLYAFDYG